MTRILIKCPNPKCNQAIPLLADAEIRVRHATQHAPTEKAEFVHEDLEKEGKIITPPEQPRTNKALWFEAVMTEWQPRDLFLAVVAKCKELHMFTKDLRTLVDIHEAGMFTPEQRDAVLGAYREAKE